MARAPALQAGGQGFDSLVLHPSRSSYSFCSCFFYYCLSPSLTHLFQAAHFLIEVFGHIRHSLRCVDGTILICCDCRALQFGIPLQRHFVNIKIQNTMKLIEIISLTAVAVFAASCEKTGNQNQNQEPEVNLSETVAGTYTGYSTAEFQYSPTPMLSQNQTLTVTAEDGGTVSVSYTSDTWGTFTISAATVAESDGTYVLSGDGKTLMGMSADSQSEYDCTLTAEISGEDDFSFVFDVPAVMGGMKITLLPGNPPVELLVNGTYTGTLTMSVMGSAMDPMEDAEVTLAVDGSTASLTLPAMGMGTMTMDSITVDVLFEEAEDGSFTLSADNIDAVSGELSITGSLTGTVSADGSTMTINAEITPGAMPMAINVDFEGTK